MRINEETMYRINKASESDFSIGTSLGGASIYQNNWQICKLDDLSKTIENLTKIRETIEKETGITF